MKLPIFKKINQTKLIQSLAILISSGIALIDALELLHKILQSNEHKTKLGKVIKQLHCGHELIKTLTEAQIFPSVTVNLIKIGMQTNNLTDLLQRAATYCLQDTENNISLILYLLEPLLTIIIGLIVGGLVIIIYIPLLQLGTVISL